MERVGPGHPVDAALAHLGQQPKTPAPVVLHVADKHHRELKSSAAKSKARLAVLDVAHADGGSGTPSAQDCVLHFGNDPVAAENCSRLYAAGRKRAQKKPRGSHYLVALSKSPSQSKMDWRAMGMYAVDQQHRA